MEKTNEAIAYRLMDIQSKVMENYSVTSRPYGDTWLMIVSDTMRSIIREGLVEKLNDEVLHILTEENWHTACHAAQKLMELRPYAMYEYVRRN